MCGIFGGVFPEFNVNRRNRFLNALKLISHRGPDDFDVKEYILPNGSTLCLAHTRLSIIDLSEGGHQPMVSTCGRYCIIFNGEIYNYLELKAELISVGVIFSTESDTEVLLNAWINWGENALSRFIGMFSFVIYDQKLNHIICARDAFGIKPFFYHQLDDEIIFSSEIQPILYLAKSSFSLNLQRCYDYLINDDYDSNEKTFFQGINHLKSAHYFDLNLGLSPLNIKPISWWTPSIKEKKSISLDSAVITLRKIFMKSISLHSRSDVKIGAALSGGVDSSAIVCSLRKLFPNIEINTFSYISASPIFNEEKWVDIINVESKCIEHKVHISNKEIFNDFFSLIKLQGEPFGSTGIYAQYMIFKTAKLNGVKVLLEGQGADELLAGYDGFVGERFLSLLEERKYIQAIKFIINWSQYPGRGGSQVLIQIIKVLLPPYFYTWGLKLFGRNNAPNWLKVSTFKKSQIKLRSWKHAKNVANKGRRVVEKLQFSLFYKYLPSLLRHGDRNAMFFSVENRVPFLTLEMANFLLSLPEDYLISSSGESKYVFKEAMRGLVPDEILNRKDKVGFGTPMASWIKDFEPIISGILSKGNLDNIFHRERLLVFLNNKFRNDNDMDWQLWRIINFIIWHDIYFNKS